MSADRARLGRRLQRLRHVAGLTVGELASRARTTVGAVGAIESGASIPAMDLLRRLARALVCGPRDILGRPRAVTFTPAIERIIAEFESVHGVDLEEVELHFGSGMCHVSLRFEKLNVPAFRAGGEGRSPGAAVRYALNAAVHGMRARAASVGVAARDGRHKKRAKK